MKTPTNTAKDERNETWLLGGNPEAIEAQEARGQTEFVESEVLPTELLYCTIEQLTDLGFVFGDRVSGDDVFTHAKLPKGWSKVATEHPMWSEIRDAEGACQARIFYKAAFYDRQAFLSWAQPK